MKTLTYLQAEKILNKHLSNEFFNSTETQRYVICGNEILFIEHGQTCVVGINPYGVWYAGHKIEGVNKFFYQIEADRYKAYVRILRNHLSL